MSILILPIIFIVLISISVTFFAISKLKNLKILNRNTTENSTTTTNSSNNNNEVSISIQPERNQNAQLTVSTSHELPPSYNEVVQQSIQHHQEPMTPPPCYQTSLGYIWLNQSLFRLLLYEWKENNIRSEVMLNFLMSVKKRSLEFKWHQLPDNHKENYKRISMRIHINSDVTFLNPYEWNVWKLIHVCR